MRQTAMATAPIKSIQGTVRRKVWLWFGRSQFAIGASIRVQKGGMHGLHWEASNFHQKDEMAGEGTHRTTPLPS